MFAKTWRRGPRGGVARPLRLIVGLGALMIGVGGMIGLLAAGEEGSPERPALQPLIVLDEQAVRPVRPVVTTVDLDAEPQPQTAAPAGVATPDHQDQPRSAPEASAAPGANVNIDEAVADQDALPTFNGRPVRPVRSKNMVVTAYSPDAASCAPYDDGITASGYSVYTNGTKLVAADTDLLPFGTLVTIPGYHDGLPVPVLDRGGAIKGNRLDVLYPTHEAALQWGVQTLEVVVWEYADEP